MHLWHTSTMTQTQTHSGFFIWRCIFVGRTAPYILVQQQGDVFMPAVHHPCRNWKPHQRHYIIRVLKVVDPQLINSSAWLFHVPDEFGFTWGLKNKCFMEICGTVAILIFNDKCVVITSITAPRESSNHGDEKQLAVVTLFHYKLSDLDHVRVSRLHWF